MLESQLQGLQLKPGFEFISAMLANTSVVSAKSWQGSRPALASMDHTGTACLATGRIDCPAPGTASAMPHSRGDPDTLSCPVGGGNAGVFAMSHDGDNSRGFVLHALGKSRRSQAGQGEGKQQE